MSDNTIDLPTKLNQQKKLEEAHSVSSASLAEQALGARNAQLDSFEAFRTMFLQAAGSAR